MAQLSIGYKDFFVPGQGQRVTVASYHGHHRVALMVSNFPSEGVPRSVLTRCGGMKGILNFAGATTVKEEAARKDQFWYFQSVFGGNPDYPFQTYPFGAMSGGTRVLEAGLSDGSPTGTMTIVEVPGLIHRLDPCVRTAGHAPRTAKTLGYEGDRSSFSLAEEADTNTIANPDIHFLWLVQQNASDTSGWDGDLIAYHDLMDIIRLSGEGEAAQFFYSGGGVTAKEIWLSLQRGFPMLLPRGSGRIVDNFIRVLDGRFDLVDANHEVLEQIQADPTAMGNVDQVTVVDSTDPRQAQRWLQDHGFGEIL